MGKRLFVLMICLLLFAACRAPSSPSTTQPTGTVTALPALLDVPTLCQYPALPTGCEVTAAAMVLQWYGEPIPPQTIASDWLTCEALYEIGHELYGPDPHEVFVGDPFSTDGYGCYATPIANAINKGSAAHTAVVIKEETLATLYDQYVLKGQPVLAWVTMEMRAPYVGTRWQLANGEEYTWIAGEHCMVFVGADATRYYFNDPRTGGVVGYDKTLCEKRFAALGREALLIA